MVFVYFAAACLVSAVLFGLLPGLQASRVDLNATLKEGSRDSGSKRGGLLSGALVVFQFMLAVVLLAGAGLFVRGLLEQRASLDGLPAAEVLSAVIQLPEDRYPDDESRFRFYDQLLTSLEGTPGLRQAAITSNPARRPVAPALRINWKASRKPNPAPSPRARRVAISPGYLGLLDVPILAGRDFDRSRWLRRPGFDHRDPRLRIARVAGSAGARQAAPRLSGAASAESRRRCGASGRRPGGGSPWSGSPGIWRRPPTSCDRCRYSSFLMLRERMAR